MDPSGAFRSEENGRVQSLDTLSCEDPAWHEPVPHIFFLDGHGNVALNQVRSSVAKRSRKHAPHDDQQRRTNSSFPDLKDLC
jgi:hypothetical protein